jgi:hypothetical protein
MNCSPVRPRALRRRISEKLLIGCALVGAWAVGGFFSAVYADDSIVASNGAQGFYSSKEGVTRQYTKEDRVRYQLWDYRWKPDPTQPITRVEVRIGEQRVYVYQGDEVAGESPITTGKPGHDTPAFSWTRMGTLSVPMRRPDRLRPRGQFMIRRICPITCVFATTGWGCMRATCRAIRLLTAAFGCRMRLRSCCFPTFRSGRRSTSFPSFRAYKSWPTAWSCKY